MGIGRRGELPRGRKGERHVPRWMTAYFSRWWLHAGRAACSAASPLAARFTPSAGEGCSVVFVRLTRHTTINALPPSSQLACSYATALLPSTELAYLLIAYAPASSRDITPSGPHHLSSPFSRATPTRRWILLSLPRSMLPRLSYRPRSIEISPLQNWGTNSFG